MSSHVVIAQCSGAKRDDAAPARALYDESDYFRKQRAYAETADFWYIQSAKHGLLSPGTVIESYDKTPKDIEDTEAWAQSIAAGLLSRHDSEGLTVEILGGKKYAGPLVPELESHGVEVVEPLRGLEIGDRKSALGDMVNQKLEDFA